MCYKGIWLVKILVNLNLFNIYNIQPSSVSKKGMQLTWQSARFACERYGVRYPASPFFCLFFLPFSLCRRRRNSLSPIPVFSLSSHLAQPNTPRRRSRFRRLEQVEKEKGFRGRGFISPCERQRCVGSSTSSASCKATGRGGRSATEDGEGR